MLMEIANNFSGYVAQNSSANTKKKSSENVPVAAKETEYANELSKLVPSMDFRVGNACSSAKSGQTLTINPKLLEKMQSDPAQEKETKDLLNGVESAMRLIDSINKATGWTTVYRHSYIDENGKYHSTSCTRNDSMIKLSDKLREERREISEKLNEKIKENAKKNKDKLAEQKEEKSAESAQEKVERLINEKNTASKDGMVYLNDEEIWSVIEATREKNSDKEKEQLGINLDLQI